ncbi:MAG: elongation factor Ts, partial [Candidatus Saccharibacteria bacterium]
LASEALKGKPAEMIDKIVDGQVKKNFAEKALLSQAYILEEGKTVEEHIKDSIAKLGENIIVGQFKRIELGVNE